MSGLPNRKKKAKKKTSEKTAWRAGIDPEIVRRRRAAVIRLRADGNSMREVADALLKLHTNGGSSLFTFIGPDHKHLDTAGMSHEELRQRAYDTVRMDVYEHRKEAGADVPDADRLADDRFVLLERYRKLFKRSIIRMEGDNQRNIPREADNGKWNALARTAMDLAARIGRLQGIETEKPIEIKLPELYRAWIDDEGSIHKSKETWDGKSIPPDDEAATN